MKHARLIVFVLIAPCRCFMPLRPVSMPHGPPGHANGLRAPEASTPHVQFPTACGRTKVLLQADADGDSSVPNGRLSGAVKKMRAWCSKFADKDVLAKLGVDAFFSYGFVSNVNAGCTIALAWLTFTRAAGLSPLAPGQWGKFSLTYVGIYATVGTIMRPFRIALAVAITPKFSAVVRAVQSRMPFYETKPRLARTVALVIISFFGNIGVTCGVTALGIYASSLVTGVAPIPPGWHWRGN